MVFSFALLPHQIQRQIEKLSRSFYLWKLRTFSPRLPTSSQEEQQFHSNVPIDVIIPLSVRHSPMLTYVVNSVRTYVRHPVRRIFVISQWTEERISQCAAMDVELVDETKVLGYAKDRITYVCRNGRNRNGWLFQQLLKLSCDKITDAQKILILDAGTCFVAPRIFCHDGQDILDQSDEWHRPYFEMYRRLLGETPVARASFICNYMLFDRDKLRSMKQWIEELHHKPFDAAIMDLIDRNECSGFSEYETYGNFVMRRWPEQFRCEYWFNQRQDLALPVNTSRRLKSISWM